MPFQILKVSVSASLSVSMYPHYTAPAPHTCMFLWLCSVPLSSTLYNEGSLCLASLVELVHDIILLHGTVKFMILYCYNM